MHSYNFHIGDYRSDTVHLSIVEHYIYRQLLDLCYLEEKPLSKDLKKLGRLIRLENEGQYETLENVLNEFFILTDNGFIHKRVNQELEKIYEKSEKARESANKRWASGAKKNSGAAPWDDNINANALRAQCEGNATHNPIPITQYKSSSSEEDCEKSPEFSPETLPKSEKNICPYEKIVEAYHAALPELPRVYKLTTARKQRIRSLWADKDELPSLSDWEKYFRYVRGSPFLMGKANTNGRARPFKADIDFLVTPGSYVKITEGKYHG